MVILVTGASGQLGHDVIKELTERGHTVRGVSSREMELTDPAAVQRVLYSLRPEAVIHCGGYTAVDAAEDDAVRCDAVNRLGTDSIARACADIQAKLLYISTDYVFSGTGTAPWRTEDLPRPLSVYGKSKYGGELAVQQSLREYFIVRVSWLFGPHGKNFVKTMLRLGQTHDTLRVVNDQIGTPTYTPDLARLAADMIVTEKYGIYHAANEGGYISWYDFACEIFRQAGMSVQVQPVSTAEYGLSRAARPCNSRLDKSRLAENGFALLPDWKDALHRFLIETEQI